MVEGIGLEPTRHKWSRDFKSLVATYYTIPPYCSEKKPIYGDKKLNKIQNNDNNKFQLCQENKISLCVIDTSSQKHFTENSSKKFLQIIKNIIDINCSA